jgi:hypothetical protein
MVTEAVNALDRFADEQAPPVTGAMGKALRMLREQVAARRAGVNRLDLWNAAELADEIEAEMAGECDGDGLLRFEGREMVVRFPGESVEYRFAIGCEPSQDVRYAITRRPRPEPKNPPTLAEAVTRYLNRMKEEPRPSPVEEVGMFCEMEAAMKREASQ